MDPLVSECKKKKKDWLAVRGKLAFIPMSDDRYVWILKNAICEMRWCFTDIWEI